MAENYDIFYRIHVLDKDALNSFAKIQASLRNLARYTKQNTELLRAFSSSLDTATRKNSAFYKNIELSTVRLNRLSYSSNLARRNLASLTTSLIGFGIVSKGISIIANFEDDVKDLEAVLDGANKKQMKALQTYALYTSSITRSNISETLQSMRELAKFGLNTAQILQASEPVIKLGNVAHMNAEDTATTLQTAINQFGLTSTKSNYKMLADSIYTGANLSSLDVEDFKKIFGKAGSAGSMANLTPQEFVALASSINNMVANRDVTATGLRTGITRIAGSGTAEAQRIFQSLGIDNKAIFQTRGLLALLEEINKKTKEIRGTTQYIDIMKGLFGLQNFSVGVAAVENLENTKEILKGIQESVGSVDRAYQSKAESLKAKIDTMKNAWQSAYLYIMEYQGDNQPAIATMIGNVIEKIGSFAQVLLSLKPNVVDFISYTFLLAGGLALVNASFTIIQFILAPITALLRGFNVVARATAGVLALLEIESLPLVAGILALAGALAGVIYLLYKFNDAFKGFVDTKIEDTKKGIADFFKGLIDPNAIKKVTDEALEKAGLGKKKTEKDIDLNPKVNTDNLRKSLDTASFILATRFKELGIEDKLATIDFGKEVAYKYGTAQTQEHNIKASGELTVKVATPDGSLSIHPVPLEFKNSAEGY